MEGCVLAALGVFFVQSGGLLTGGTPGLALVAHQFLPLTLGSVLILVNLPFFLLGLKQLGWWFTLVSLACLGATAAMIDILNLLMTLAIPTWLSAILGGSFIGFGLVLVLGQGASLGGLNILAVSLAKHVSPSVTLLVTDALIISAGLFWLPLEQVLMSLLTVVAMTSVLARYRKAPKPAPQVTGQLAET